MQPPSKIATPRNSTSPANLVLSGVLALLGLGLLVWFNASFVVPLKALDVPVYGNDMSYFWAASRTVWQGGNPYITDPGSVYQTIRIAEGGDATLLDPFKSPFYLTLLFMPFAVFPLGVTAILWLLTMQLLLGAAVVMLVRQATGKLTPAALLAGLGMAIVWRYSFLVMMVGNLSLLLLFAITASFYYSSRGRPFVAGLAAALLLIKPQVVFLIIPILLFVPGTSKAELIRRLQGFFTVAVIFAVYSFSLKPDWLGEWLRVNLFSTNAYFNNTNIDSDMTSLRGVVALFVTDKGLVQPLSIALAVPFWLGLGWLWWRQRYNRHSFPYLLSITIAVNILTSPYIREYENALLLFGILYSYFSLRSVAKVKGKWFSYFFWLLIFLPYPIHLAASAIGNLALEVVIPTLVLLASCLVWRLTETAARSRPTEKSFMLQN